MPLPEDVFWAGDERGIPHRMVREGDGFREDAMKQKAAEKATAGVPISYGCMGRFQEPHNFMQVERTTGFLQAPEPARFVCSQCGSLITLP